MNKFREDFDHLRPKKSDSLKDLDRKRKAVQGALATVKKFPGCSNADKVIKDLESIVPVIECEEILRESGCDLNPPAKRPPKKI